MVDKNEGLDKILEFIESKAPNIYQLILEYTRKVKIDLIGQHLDQDLEDTKEVLSVTEEVNRISSGDARKNEAHVSLASISFCFAFIPNQ